MTRYLRNTPTTLIRCWTETANPTPNIVGKRKLTYMNEVLFEIIGNAGLITLNRPRALNALNLAMAKSLHTTLKKWRKQVSFIIIKGKGEKAFCAGGDIRAVTKRGQRDMAIEFFRHEYTTNYIIGTLKIPYIALMDGITMGGGVGLSVHGKYRVATERTIFAMPETAIGLFPDVGASYFLPRLPSPLGMYYGLTGYRLIGLDVLKGGIATHFCQSSMIKTLEEELLNVSEGRFVEPILAKYTNHYLNENDREFVLKSNYDRIRKHFTADSVEKIVQSLQSDHSPWGVQHMENLMKMSPTSLKVTLKALKEGARMNLKRCLEMEFRIVNRMLASKDFTEGVRAMLIDKDKKPRWKPNKLELVTRDMVDDYFMNLKGGDELEL